MNSFQLAGRVLEAPIKSETSTGIKLAHIKLRIDKVKDDETVYEDYDVLVFRQLAELELVPGQYIGIVGKLSPNNYEKDGTQYFNCNLIGNSISLQGK